MHVVPIRSVEQWGRHAGAWNLLTRGVPFRRWEWLSTWWRHYGSGNELVILAVFDHHGTIVAAAPWYGEQCGSRGLVLRSLGTGEVCSDYLTVLCSAEFEHQATAALAQWLLDDRHFPQWDLLDLECVTVHDSALPRLVRHLERAGCSVVATAGPNLWKIPLPATWEEYLSRLSKSHRKQIQRLLRKRGGAGGTRLVHARSAAELDWGLARLVELHQRRWRLAGQPGVFASPRYAAFLHDAARQLFASQALQLSTLELDGRPAAVDFHLVNSCSSFVYQGGIEPELAAESPGKLLTVLLIQDAIAAGRETFDFLRGDERYKPHFRAVPVPSTNFHVVPRRATAQVRHSLWAAGIAVRNLVKSGVSRAGILH